jgi:hypothetical protein
LTRDAQSRDSVFLSLSLSLSFLSLPLDDSDSIRVYRVMTISIYTVQGGRADGRSVSGILCLDKQVWVSGSEVRALLNVPSYEVASVSF